MIKIISGFSSMGGSTEAFINLTNSLNEKGYETCFYGPHEYHLDKCNSKLIKEISFKHRESFSRTVNYLKDMKNAENEDFYSIELYNLQKSIELFKSQSITFDKKIEKFTDNLNEFIKREKVKREKISFTLFLVFFSLLILSLKYNLIWGENNGYINSSKKSEN